MNYFIFYFLFLLQTVTQLTAPMLIDNNAIHRNILLLSPVLGFFTAGAGVIVGSFFGVVVGVLVGAIVDPVAGISTAARLNPHTVHSSCLEPFCVAVASLSTIHFKLCYAVYQPH